MRIRSKLTLLFVCFAVAPLAAVQAVSLATTRRMADRLAAEAGNAQRDRTLRELHRAATQAAATIRAERAAAELALTALAQAAKAELEADDDSVRSRPPPSPPRLPGGVTPPHAAAQLARDDAGSTTIEPTPHIANPPPNAPALLDRRLDAIAHRMRSLAQSTDAIAWHRLALANGASVSYPSVVAPPTPNPGPNPAPNPGPTEDPRNTPWYAASSLGPPGIVWLGPRIDPQSGLAVLTAAAPVQDASGRRIGVVSVDLSIRRLLRTIQQLEPAAADPAALLLESQDPRRRLWMLNVGRATPTDLPADLPDNLNANPAAPPPNPEAQAPGPWPLSIPLNGRDALLGTAEVAQGLWAAVATPSDLVQSEAALTEQTVLSAADSAAGVAVATAAAAFLLASAVAYIAGKSITRPIRRLTQATHRIAEGDLDADPRIRGHDEIARLAQDVRRMAPRLADSVRLRESIELTRHVHRAALPAVHASPTIPGFDPAGATRYCEASGGDYYDFIERLAGRDGLSAVAIGDVAGHGVPAALLMAGVRAALRAHATSLTDPGELLTALNAQIAQDRHDGRFMSLLYLVVSAPSPLQPGQLLWASAGHHPPRLYTKATDRLVALDGASSLPIGVAPATVYTTCRAPLPQPGEILLLTTDGLPGAKNPQGRAMGWQPIHHALREATATTAATAATLAAAVLAAAERHRGPAQLCDDMTCVVLRATAQLPQQPPPS